MAATITVTSAEIDLFHLAARLYGDATLWFLIARANGLIDPQINGLTTLVIPPADPTQSGGVPAQ